MAEPLGRVRGIALAVVITLAIVAVELAFPTLDFASAEIVPLLLLVRAVGLRLTVVLAVVSAPLLVGLDSLLRRQGSLLDFVLDAGLLIGLFVVVVALVEHYRNVLVRAGARDADAFARGRAVSRDRDLASIAEAIPQLVWASRGDGTAEYFNSAWYAYTGLSRGALASGGIEGTAHPDDAGLVREAWSATRSGRVFDLEFRIRARDGSYGWFLARATPLFGDDGSTIVRWFGTCTDIDARKRSETALGLRFAEAGRISDAFARASLPSAFPDVPGVTFDAAYRADVAAPGVDGARAPIPATAVVGGCWYDALRLVDGRLLLAVGEVAGGGHDAATVMVAVRQAMRGAAAARPDPPAILEAVDRTLHDEALGRRVTAFVGIYDPVTERLAFANAGHPPPLLRTPDGATVALAAPGRPFGARHKGDSEVRAATIPAGSVLVLHTAAVLGPASDGDATGDRALRAALATLESDAPARAILDAVLGSEPGGDLALLVVSFGATAARLARWSFETAHVAAARAVRGDVIAAVAEAGASEIAVGDADTIFAELVDNVSAHAPGPCDIALDLTGRRPVLHVLDRGGSVAGAISPAAGRGLFIVRSLAIEFDASPRAGGGTHARAVLRG